MNLDFLIIVEAIGVAAVGHDVPGLNVRKTARLRGRRLAPHAGVAVLGERAPLVLKLRLEGLLPLAQRVQPEPSCFAIASWRTRGGPLRAFASVSSASRASSDSIRPHAEPTRAVMSSSSLAHAGSCSSSPCSRSRPSHAAPHRAAACSTVFASCSVRRVTDSLCERSEPHAAS